MASEAIVQVLGEHPVCPLVIHLGIAQALRSVRRDHRLIRQRPSSRAKFGHGVGQFLL